MELLGSMFSSKCGGHDIKSSQRKLSRAEGEEDRDMVRGIAKKAEEGDKRGLRASQYLMEYLDADLPVLDTQSTVLFV